MTEAVVDLLTDQGNNAVLQLPGRRYPGVLLQGDTLLALKQAADAALERARIHKDETLLDAVTEVTDGLNLALSQLIRTTTENGLDVPYLKNIKTRLD